MELKVEQKEKLDRKERDKLEAKLVEQKKEAESAQVHTSSAQVAQQSKIENEKQKLQDYDEAMRRIKDATGVSDVNEIIQKFATQDDIYSNLVQLKRENEKKLLDLTDQKLELKKEIERLHYQGLEAMTRKQVDEVEKNVRNAQCKFDRNKDRLERINQNLVNVKAGVEHLQEKLTDIRLEGVSNVVVTDNTLVEALVQVEQKVDYLHSKVVGEKLQNEEKKKNKEAAPEPTVNNIRVKLPDKDDEDLSEVDMEAEIEAEANERMKIKLEAQLRYDRMNKTKGRKTKGGQVLSSAGKRK